MKISDIPSNLRPREKALQFGIEKLSDQELIALIIGSGVLNHSAIDIAGDLLKTHAYSLETLSKASYVSLESYLGLKKSNALRLLATFEFNKRLNSPEYKTEIKISTPGDVYTRYKYLENFEQEVLVLMMLDLKHRIVKEKILYKGTFDSFQIDVRQVVQELILAKAKIFVLVHNHPDEVNYASDQDILATNVIEKTAKNMGIKLFDHIIIYKGGFYSIKNL